MHAVRAKKLLRIILWLMFLSCCISLLLYALKQNISLFYTPSQLQNTKIISNQAIRIGGMVLPGSIKRNKKNLDIEFIITDKVHNVLVHYTGVLPDLFREGQGIVAHGVLKPTGYFLADEVLAKHDEKYMPPLK